MPCAEREPEADNGGKPADGSGYPEDFPTPVSCRNFQPDRTGERFRKHVDSSSSFGLELFQDKKAIQQRDR